MRGRADSKVGGPVVGGIVMVGRSTSGLMCLDCAASWVADALDKRSRDKGSVVVCTQYRDKSAVEEGAVCSVCGKELTV